MRRFSAHLFLSALFLGSVPGVLADVPRTVTYQGKLPGFANETVSLTVSFYDAEIGGNALYSETLATPLTNGVFAVILGESIGVPDTALDAAEIWVGLAVDADPEMPRTRVGMNPFAAKASASERLVQPDTFTPIVIVDDNGNVGINTLAPTSMLDIFGGSIRSRRDAVQWAELRNTDASGAHVTACSRENNKKPVWLDNLHDGSGAPAGTLDFHFRTGPTSSPRDIMVLTESGELGLGASTPQADLHVLSGAPTRQLIQHFAAQIPSAPASTIFEMQAIRDFIFGGDDIATGRLRVSNATNGTKLFSMDADDPDMPISFQVDSIERMRITPSGRVGIGTQNPESMLDMRTGGSEVALKMRAAGSWVAELRQNSASMLSIVNGGFERMTISPGGNIGVGTTAPTHRLHVSGNAPSAMIESEGTGAAFLRFNRTGDPTNAYIALGSNNNLFFKNGGFDRMVITEDGDVGIGTLSPGHRLDVAGRTRTHVLEITGGSDLSESFDVRSPEGQAVEPGMVVCIDPENAGKLVVSRSAYDATVAGIISGAGGVNTGMVMGQTDTIASGAHPVALTGRVWTRCDTANGPIKPGDLLTTAEEPGCAMRAADPVRAQGAIIGKAMTALDSGEGLVLVLVSLQ